MGAWWARWRRMIEDEVHGRHVSVAEAMGERWAYARRRRQMARFVVSHDSIFERTDIHRLRQSRAEVIGG